MAASLIVGGQDEPLLTPANSGKFSLHNAWEQLCDHAPKQPLVKAIWFSGNIPRASLINWMALLDRLGTKARMQKWKIQLPSELCKFCGMLCFSCVPSPTMCGRSPLPYWLSSPGLDWTSGIDWLLHQLGKSLDMLAYRLLWTQYAYMAWIERNNRIFEKKVTGEEALSLSIVDMVKMKPYTLP